MDDIRKYVLRVDFDKHFPKIRIQEEANRELNDQLTKTGKQLVEALERLQPEMVDAFNRYRCAFEAAAEKLPGWTADNDGWKFDPNQEEILTRDEAFASFDKRKKKGRRTWRY